jgi:hypothetical protein
MANTKTFNLPAASNLDNVAVIVTQGAFEETAVTKKAALSLFGISEKLTNPMTTEHDIIVGGASGAPARVGIPSASLVGRVATGAIEGITASDLTELDRDTEQLTLVGFNGSGAMRKFSGTHLCRHVAAPANAGDPGEQGDVANDASYIYVHDGTAWVRAALTSW